MTRNMNYKGNSSRPNIKWQEEALNGKFELKKNYTLFEIFPSDWSGNRSVPRRKFLFGLRTVGK